MVSNIYYTEKNFYPEYESFCFQNGVRQILEYYGIDNACFYINSTLSLILRIDKNEKYGYNINYDDTARTVLPGFKNKIKRYEEKGKDFITVWEANKMKIEKDLPIIVGVDAYHLDYLPFYKKNHTRHTVTLAGFDDAKKKVYLVDWYEPWFYKGTVGYEDFLLARNSENPQDGSVYSGSPINNNWAEIEKEGWEEDSVKLLFDTISLSIDQYYKKRNDQNELRGFPALKYLFSLIKNQEHNEISDRKLFFADLHQKIFTIPKRIKIFRLYLVLFQSDKAVFLNPAINLLNKVISCWDFIMLFVLKAGYSNKDGAILKILSKFKELLTLVEELNPVLEKTINKIS